MARIRRAKETAHFTILANALIRDPRLSFRATGILCFLLSLPPEVDIDSSDLAELRKEGREAVRTALRELEAAGYLRRPRLRNTKGQWITDWEVSSVPTLPGLDPAEYDSLDDPHTTIVRDPANCG